MTKPYSVSNGVISNKLHLRFPSESHSLLTNGRHTGGGGKDPSRNMNQHFAPAAPTWCKEKKGGISSSSSSVFTFIRTKVFVTWMLLVILLIASSQGKEMHILRNTIARNFPVTRVHSLFHTISRVLSLSLSLSLSVYWFPLTFFARDVFV